MANHLCGTGESMAASRHSRDSNNPASSLQLSSFLIQHPSILQPLHRSIQSSVFDVVSCSLMMAARTMGTASVMTSLVVVVALAFSKAAKAQGNGCSSVMMTLSPCMDFISSKAPEPGISCCSVLAGVVQSDPRCLCMVLDGTATNFGIAINQTRAMELPGVCKVKAPAISQCSGIPSAPSPTPSNESAAAKEKEEPEASADGPSGNGTSSSTNSKNAASLMATALTPICVLLYAF